MRKITLAILGIALWSSVAAQSKNYTMQDATLGLRSNLAPENFKQFYWLGDQNAFVYTKDNTVIKTEVPSMKSSTFFTLADFNNAIFGKDSLKSISTINWDNKKPYVKIGNILYVLDEQQPNLKFSQWLPLPAKSANLKVKDNVVAYTIENNLFFVDRNGKTHEVTNDTQKTIVNGQSVHRNEFGIDGGIFISPQNNLLAFYRMDESMVADYPIIDWSVTPAINKNINYPMAGGTSHEVLLGVFNPSSGKTVYMQTGAPKDQYLTAVTWAPDEQSIYIALLNREQNHMRLNQYNASTGAFMKTLFEEKDDKYVEPQHPLYFLPNNNNEFLWWSARSGFHHLYRYNVNGKLLNTVTKGDWLVNDIVGVNAKKNEIIITATKESPLEKHGYAVNWKNGKMRRLDIAPGVHSIEANKTGNYILDRYSNATTPRVIEVADIQGKFRNRVLTATDPLKDYYRPKVEQVQLKADDGTPLYGKLVYPMNFDASKKYPVIVYLYNGPHVQLITNSYPASGNLWYEYLAQNGYVVFSMDGRGSANRGQKFEQAVFRQLGTVEMNDQLKGVDYLKTLPFVDAERMGVHGWSFGGFMTTSLMLRHPNVFKVGVAGGPVIDWRMYEVMYTERYMDTPQENPKGYEDNDLLTKVDQLKGKLLMVHGAQDNVVVWQHSMKFVKACVDKGIQLDYFVYPGHEHNVLGKDRIHLMQKITDYFDEYLK